MKIKELAEEGLFCDGDWVESKDQDPYGDIRLIQLADIGDGNFIDKSSRFMNKETAERLNCTYLKKGDILIARMPDPIGRACLFPLNEDEKYVTVVDIGVLRLPEEHHSKYVMYGINSPLIRRQIEGQVTGTTRQRITRKKIGEIDLPLPPLETQKKIASILDAADGYRQKTQALIEKYDELTQSLFLEMFGDPFTNKKEFPTAKLGDLCDELFLGLTSKVDYVDEGGFPLIRATDINKGVLNLDNVRFISEEQHRKLTARRITKRGDVLISKSGSLGTCAIVDTDVEFSTYESIFTVRPKASLLSNTFLIHLVRNEGFQLKLLGKQVGGTVAHLNLKMFRDFEFPLPPVTDQELFTERALYLGEQKAQAQQSLEKAEELFNSLLQRAFKRELN